MRGGGYFPGPTDASSAPGDFNVHLAAISFDSFHPQLAKINFLLQSGENCNDYFKT